MANPAFIQGNTTTTGTGQTSAACAFNSNVTAGSLLYCTVRLAITGGSLTNITCADNNGNSWSPTTAIFSGGDNWRSFYVIGANAGATTVTITITGANGFIRMAISESGPGITGLDTVGIWTYAASSVTLQYANGINTSQSNVYAIMGGGQNTTSTTVTGGGGFTVEIANAPGDAFISDMFSALPLASSGAGNVTWGASTKGALLMVTFTTATSAAANLWTRKGQVVQPLFADFTSGLQVAFCGVEAPNVIVEGNPKIYTKYAQVFKMWFQAGENTAYAESVDGLNFTRYASNVLTNALYFPRVTKSGGTYYMSGVRASAFPWTAIDIYSSIDGLTWTIYQSGTISLDASFNSFTHGLLWIEGGTWYLIYDEYNSSAQTYQIGVATSSDGHTFSKQGIIITTNHPSGPFLQKINGIYYIWAESWLFGQSGLTGASDMYRWHASSITGTWTMDGCSMHRTEADEGPDSIGTNGEVADLCMVQVGSQTFMYYVNVPVQGSQTNINSYIKCAVASTTLAGVVASGEGTATDSIGTSGSVGGAIVQSNSFASSVASGPNSPGLAYTSNNTANNSLLLLARITDGANVNIGLTGVTDTAGNTWKFAFAFANPGNVASNFDTVIGFFVPQCLAGANTVTIHTTDATALFWNITILEYTSLGSNPSVLACCYAGGTSGVSGTAGLIGNLHARQGGVMVSIFGNPTTNGLTLTPGTGWTNRQTMNGNTVVADSLAAAAGIFQAPMGFSSSVPWEGGLVLLGSPIPVQPIFPPAGGGGFGNKNSFGYKFGF